LNGSVVLGANGVASIGSGSLVSDEVDNCGVGFSSLDRDEFVCADVSSVQEVVVTVTDVNGNNASATTFVSVRDETAPVVEVVGGVDLYLNSSGYVMLTVGDVEVRSSDACGVLSRVLSREMFSCADAGKTFSVNLTVTDVNGNVHVNSTDVVIHDDVAPTVSGVGYVTVLLDSNGKGSINTSDVDAGSVDNCAFELSLDVDSFSCNDVGNVSVMLTGTDGSANVGSTMVTVSVVDSVSPMAWSGMNVTLELDSSGNRNVSVSDVLGIASDNCDVTSEVLDVHI